MLHACIPSTHPSIHPSIPLPLSVAALPLTCVPLQLFSTVHVAGWLCAQPLNTAR
jgi:hypothetical protein